jgi:hypothetical protein
VPLPLGGLFDVQGVEASARALLESLDFTAPARIDLGSDGSRRADVGHALTVIAADAAEELALPPTAPPALVAQAAALGLRAHGSAAAAIDGQVGAITDAVGRFAGIAVPSLADAVSELVSAGLLDPSEEG